MKLFDELIGSIAQDAPVRRVFVGVHWTAVSSRGCGMALTVMGSKPHGEDKVRDAGELEKKTALELAHYVYCENTLEASIGFAALNSLIQPPSEGLVEINAFKYLVERGAGKHVAIFGHFPYLDELRSTASQVTVFELAPVAGEHHLNEAPKLLPDAEIVAITSNSLINHTLTEILPHIKTNAFIALVGPTTPLSQVLFDYGIHMLSGVQIVDEDALYLSVSQAAIFRQMWGVKQVIWIA
jgi:hypothetical protein